MTVKKDKTKQTDAKPESRRERRKRETRERLMRAAMTLMATVGKEGAVINQITEAADVGFGSFYNHFESKEDIYNQLAYESLNSLAETLNQIAETTDDPAEVMAASIRHAMHRIIQDPVWGRFVIRLSYSPQVFSQSSGQYFLRDVQKGMVTGRFKASDPMMAIIAVSGTLLSAAAMAVELAQGDETVPAGPTAPLFFDKEQLPERTAAMVLRILGMDEADVIEVANRPLPEIEI
ncbi:MAG: TetR/AcrR family transcriptional regulator [Myxococcota bacterium]